MKYFKLEFANGSFEIVQAESIRELIKKYDLASKKHLNTKIKQLKKIYNAISDANKEKFKTVMLKDVYKFANFLGKMWTWVR